MALTQRLRARTRAWIDRRSPPQTGPVRIHRRRLYILPTRGGAWFGLLLFTMLLGSMNYSNSLGFALTFLLGGLVLVAMHHTHRNLLNLTVRAAPVAPVFAGQPALLAVVLHNPAGQSRLAVAVAADDTVDAQDDAVTDIPAGGDAICRLSLTTRARGRLPLPRLKISTLFPMGLFRAWTWIRLDQSVLVYPRPAGRAPLPPASPGLVEGADRHRTGREDFAGLRRYGRGDPPRLIHWKSYPRTGTLMVKQFDDPRQETLWLDFAMVTGGGVEPRLSQLTRWVQEADRRGLVYGLRLPGAEIPPDRGAPHRDRCLRSLALYAD